MCITILSRLKCILLSHWYISSSSEVEIAIEKLKWYKSADIDQVQEYIGLKWITHCILRLETLFILFIRRKNCESSLIIIIHVYKSRTIVMLSTLSWAWILAIDHLLRPLQRRLVAWPLKVVLIGSWTIGNQLPLSYTMVQAINYWLARSHLSDMWEKL
jgi:hypothetical protein